jgi:small subunit ribosomal protein S11
MYPDETTPTRLFNGIPFRDVPICDIKASKNNTIISVSNAQGGFIIASVGI